MEWWQTIIASLISGTSVGVLNYYLSRRKISAEILLIRAQSDKVAAEAEKIRTEIKAVTVAHTSELEGVSAGLASVQAIARETADTVKWQSRRSLSDDAQAKLLNSLGRMARRRVSEGQEEATAAELIALGLVKESSAGFWDITSAGRRALAAGRLD